MWAETIYIFSCATLLWRTMTIYLITNQKWITFEPRITTQATITNNRSTITLILHDLYHKTKYFNFFEPEGDFRTKL